MIFFQLSATLMAQSAMADSPFDFLLKKETDYERVLVTKIISADTIVLEGGETVRLIGIKAPKPPRKKKQAERDDYGFVIKEDVNPITSIEERAFNFATELLMNKFVRLEFDHEKKTEDFATYAYAFLVENNLFVNLEILRQGFANLQIRPPNTKYDVQLREAYQEARYERRGLQGE